MTRRIVSVGLAAVLAMGTAAAQAAPAADTAELRELFLQAERAIEGRRPAEFRRLESTLRDYPLYPYLRFAELQSRLGRLTPEEVDGFTTEFGDSPLAARLRHAWLRHLARRGEPRQLVAHFSATQDTDLQCRYAAALWQLADPRAGDWSERLWLSGRSQPSSCDSVFANWREAGGLTAERVWARVELALSAGNPGLARYLDRFLPESERPWLDRWLAVRRDPQALVGAEWLDRTHPVLGAILADGLRSLARHDPIEAADHWLRVSHKGQTAVRQARVTHFLALHLAQAGSPVAKERLMQLASALEQDEDVLQWFIIDAMAGGDWATALAWLERRHASVGEDARWSYWHARALGELGRHEEAEAIFVEVAADRSFYGFLAADRIGKGYHFGPRPVRFSPDELESVAALPGLQRAYELLQIGRTVDARREWHHTLGSLDERRLQLAARLAHEWGWHDRVIFTLAQAEYWDDIELRFPLAHQELILDQSEQRQINPAWAFAMIRQESAFTADARSYAGAVGLMQLMPSTARHMARILEVAGGALDLTDAPTNIRLGVAYLNHVRERFEGHPVLSTAAYNAGPFRVEQWIPTERDMPADLWIESVPYAETREYLKRVLAYTIIYEKRLGRTPAPIAEYMPPIPARATLLTQDASTPGGKGG